MNGRPLLQGRTMPYTLIAGTRNWSSWSLRPYMALKTARVPFGLEVVRLRQGADSKTAILSHSPAGKVPVLKIAESGHTLTLWDSLAICETLAERHPEAGLLPDDAGARALMRSYAAEMHAGFPDLRDQLSMDFARRLPCPALRETTEAEIGRILSAWESALTASDGPFLFGRLSIADCMYAPVVSRFITYGITVPAAAGAYMERVMALPAMIEWGRMAEEEVAQGLA
jgi:glutathione S-transferase